MKPLLKVRHYAPCRYCRRYTSDLDTLLYEDCRRLVYARFATVPDAH